MKIQKIHVVKDNEGDWYWIPENKINQFEKDDEELCGLEYMDNPGLFDLFMDNYSHFKTGGDSNIEPDFYKNQSQTK